MRRVTEQRIQNRMFDIKKISRYRQLFTISTVFFSNQVNFIQVYKQSEYETYDLPIALLRIAYDHAIFI